MTIKLKLTKNNNLAYVASPGSTPKVIVSGTDLSGYVTNSQLTANLANYTPSANLQLSSLTDVVAVSPSNNATLVYSTANNKYVVKQLDLDGGNF